VVICTLCNAPSQVAQEVHAVLVNRLLFLLLLVLLLSLYFSLCHQHEERLLDAEDNSPFHEIRVKDVNRLEKNDNENATRTLILTSLAAAAAGDGLPDDIKNNQEKGMCCGGGATCFPNNLTISCY